MPSRNFQLNILSLGILNFMMIPMENSLPTASASKDDLRSGTIALKLAQSGPSAISLRFLQVRVFVIHDPS